MPGVPSATHGLKKMKNLFVFLLATTCLVLLIEGGARFAEWHSSKLYIPERLDEEVRAGPMSGFNRQGLGDARPDLDTLHIELKHFPFHYRTNGEGFRADIEYDPDKKTILTLGASFTFGTYVSNAATYPSWLQSILNRRLGEGHDIQVMNAGRPGYTIEESLAYLREKGSRMRNAVAVLQIDVYSVALPDDRGGLHFRDIAKQDQPPLEGPVYRLKRFLRTYSAAANMINRLRSSWREKDLVRKVADDPRRRTVEDDRRIFYAPDAPASRPHWERFKAKMAEFAKLAASNGMTPVALLFPGVEQLISKTFPTTPQQTYKELFDELGIVSADPLADLRSAGSVEAVTLLHHPVGPGDFKKPKSTKIRFPVPIEYTKSGDVHFSRYGNYLIARAVADVLARENLLVPANQ